MEKMIDSSYFAMWYATNEGEIIRRCYSGKETKVNPYLRGSGVKVNVNEKEKNLGEIIFKAFIDKNYDGNRFKVSHIDKDIWNNNVNNLRLIEKNEIIYKIDGRIFANLIAGARFLQCSTTDIALCLSKGKTRIFNHDIKEM